MGRGIKRNVFYEYLMTVLNLGYTGVPQ